jgi:hypothetical protein
VHAQYFDIVFSTFIENYPIEGLFSAIMGFWQPQPVSDLVFDESGKSFFPFLPDQVLIISGLRVAFNLWPIRAIVWCSTGETSKNQVGLIL